MPTREKVMSAAVLVRRDDGVTTVLFNRPEKRNALDMTMSGALAGAVDEAAGTGDVLVLRSSTPGMFVAGTDVQSLRDRSVADSLARLNARLFQRLADHPAVTVAVVEGWALGGGCELALACDLRLSTPDARWGLPEVRLGLVPSAGGLHRLSEIVGQGTANDLILTGRRIDGREAHRIGLVQRLMSDGSIGTAIDELLAELARTSPLAVRLAKEAMRVTGDRHRLVDAVAQALSLASGDTQERLAALLANRSDGRA